MAMTLDCRSERRGAAPALSRWRALAACLILGGVLTAATAAPDAPSAPRPLLRFIVGEDWASPYLELRGGRPVGGLAYDLMEAVARAAGAQPDYLMLPPKRTQAALHAGQADLMCMMNPGWVAEPLSVDRVGPPMVVLEDVIAVRPGAGEARPLDLSAQHGLRVGTVLGYRYLQLGPLFDDGRLLREDAATQQGVLEKLARGRTEVAVVERLVLAQYNRAHAPAERLVALQVVGRAVTHCLLAGKPLLPAPQLHQALRSVVERGELARLMQRYR